MDRKLYLVGIVACLALALAACRPVTREGAVVVAESAKAPGDLTWDATVEEQMASAMSAAPLSLSQNATILGYAPNSDSEPPVLREGTNRWTCTPDWPDTPGASPECFNPAWQEFWKAATMEKKPDFPTIGLNIMMMGGTEVSTTDPNVTEPAPGEDYIRTPPHLMVTVPWDLDPADFSVDGTSGLPYIMWEGTTLEHLMIPVNLTDFEEADPQIKNAMSAAPLVVAKDATIVAFPTEPGGEMQVLREGTNGWTCYTDWTVSPTNDPECNDPMFEAWFTALMSGEASPPEITKPGIAFMLQGGSDPSNTDPMAAAPAAGEDWVTSPAHIMLIAPGGFDPKDYSTDPASGEPFIMWEGTPYEHLMFPVADSAE